MQRDRWSFPMLVREALRNVFSLTGRLYPLVAVAVLLGVGQTALFTWQAQELDATLDAQTRLGRNVVAIAPRPPDREGAVDRQSCEGLVALAGVERAGLLVPTTARVDVPELGPVILPVAASTTLVPGLRTHDVVVGAALWPAQGDLTLRTPDGQVLSATVGPEEPAGLDVGAALAVPLAPDVTAGPLCLVVLDPLVTQRDAVPVLLGALESEGDALVVDSAYTQTVDVLAAHLGRAERFVPVGIGLLGAFCVLVLSAFRSSELAAYRLSGTSRRSLVLLVGVEQALVAGVYLMSATATVLVVGLGLRDPSVPVLWALVGALTWTVGAGAAAALASVRKASDLAKDR